MKKRVVLFIVVVLLISLSMNATCLKAVSAANPGNPPAPSTAEEVFNARMSDIKASLPKGAVIDKVIVTTVYFDQGSANSETAPGAGVTPDWGSPYYYIVATFTYEQHGGSKIAETSGGPGPGSLTLSQTVSVANSWSANVGVSASVVSAGVGFTVTATVTKTCGYTAQIPSGQYARIDAYPVNQVNDFDVWYNPLLGDAYYAGWGYAIRCIGVDYTTTYWH